MNYDYQACRELTYAYDYGRGLPADPALAFYWLNKAIDCPHYNSESQQLDALIADFWKRHQASETEIRIAEEQLQQEEWSRDLVKVKAWEGMRARANGRAPLFEMNEAAGKDKNVEFAHYQKSSQQPQGQWDALLAGQMAQKHEVPAANPSQAFSFFSRANPDWVETQFGLGMCYLKGLGVQADPQKAREWLEKAASYQRPSRGSLSFIGSADAFVNYDYKACRELALAYDFGRGLPADAVQAANWYGKAFYRPHYEDETQELDALTADFRQRNPNINPTINFATRANLSDATRTELNNAAARGDLAAALRLYKNERRRGVAADKTVETSLRTALETAARGGDQGAKLALAVALGGNPGDAYHVFDATGGGLTYWNTQIMAGAAKKAELERVAADPNATNADYNAARAAAQLESEAWLDMARNWSLENAALTYDIALDEARFAKLDKAHRDFVRLRERAPLLETQLDSLEKSVVPRVFNPESDDSFIEGYEAWIPRFSTTTPDYLAALDAFSRSAALGHPFAPMAIATFYSSGAGGFPRDLVLAKRWRALAASRMEILAQSGDVWAQITLGNLLTEKPRVNSREELWDQ